MKFIGFAFTIILFSCVEHHSHSKQNTSNPNSLIAFEENDLWGFKSTDVDAVIPPKYLIVYDFNDHGGAAVLDENGWLFINQAGEELLKPFIFDNGPDAFKEGLARFVEEGKIGFFNPAGDVVIPAKFDFAYPFEQGQAKACEGCESVKQGDHSVIEGGTWFKIDKTGARVEN